MAVQEETSRSLVASPEQMGRQLVKQCQGSEEKREEDGGLVKSAFSLVRDKEKERREGEGQSTTNGEVHSTL